MRQRGFTLIELMIVIAIIAVIAAIAIPGLLSSQRASNERNASTSLKTLTSAEADFRANDREGNKVNDFWTGNISGLYTMTSAAIVGSTNSTTDPSVKLIELSIASADASGTTPLAGGENAALTTFALPAAKAGYWYNALVTDSGSSGAEATYQQDTGGTISMGSVHNFWKFGFPAWPESRSAGKFVYVIDENNTIFRSAISTNVSPSAASPPGTLATPYDSFRAAPISSPTGANWTRSMLMTNIVTLGRLATNFVRFASIGSKTLDSCATHLASACCKFLDNAFGMGFALIPAMGRKEVDCHLP